LRYFAHNSTAYGKIFQERKIENSFNKDGRMENKLKKIIACIPYALLFAYLTVFVFGCNESTQTTSEDFSSAKMSPIQAVAYRIIQESLADSNPVIRGNAIEVVVTTRQIRLMPKVQRLLGDEFAPVRFSAALAIGDLEYSFAKSSVSRLLKDQDVNVIVAAAYAMGRLGSAEYFEVVRKAIDSDDQVVRANAAFLLGKIQDTSALKLLKWVQEDRNSSDKVRFQALEARARLGDGEVLKKLWAIVYSGYADDRIMGVRALGILGTSKAKEILITKLDDNILEVRLAAAEQLGKFRDRTGEPEVLAVFENNISGGLDLEAIERTNVLAALAIGQIGTPALTKFLPQLLKNESKFVRIAAAQAVFQCKMK
jgi:HEAT repeat protein